VRRRVLQGIGAAVVASLTAVAVFVPGGGSASAATAASCGFASAGTGTYAQTLCWFDLSGYDAAQATSAAGQQLTVALPGGYTMNFTLNVSGSAVRPVAYPTYSAAYLGQNGHYADVAGKPALYQSQSGPTTATLSNIGVTNSAGGAVTGYALVGADAESSDDNESITWTSTAPIQSLTQSIGNACGGGFTGVSTTTVVCTGRSTGTKTGTAILAAQNPTTFSQRMIGSGRQAVAFGVLISKVQLNKSVVNGLAGDTFGISVKDSDGSTVGSANTSGGPAASTGQLTVLTGANGADFTLAETATAGTLSNYTQSWTCTRNGTADPSVPPTSGASASVHVDVGDFENCTITNTGRPVGITLTKTAVVHDTNRDGLPDAGDQIDYTFTVTNSGELTLTTVAVHDDKVGTVTCAQTTLAPGASTTCATTPYSITAADQSAGTVDNTATATGVPPGAIATITSAPASTHTPLVAPHPAITLVKSASAGPYTVDQPITYSFAVTNSGNVALTDVHVDEGPFTGHGTMSPIRCPVTTLAPGAATTCTATYTITQADVDAGSIHNTATATGIPPANLPPTTSTPSEVTVLIPAAPGITLEKSADPTTVHAAGDPVTYRFVVGNSGNVTLTDLSVRETAFSGTGTPPVVNCPVTTLAPGASTTCTASYSVTQADIDAGTITNSATATGTSPTGAPVTDTATAVVNAPSAPALTLVKSASPNDKASFVVGRRITYSFAVTNTGNVTLADVHVDEGTFTGHGSMSPITCPITTLAPGVATTCTATYTVTQADVDAGSVENAATATGTPPTGPPTVSPPSTVTVPGNRAPALTLVKKASPAVITAAGQTVHYTFGVTNTGNVTVHAVGIDEGRFSGHGALSSISCPVTTLAPGVATTCTGTYRIVGADLHSRELRNTATATGTTAGGPVESGPSTATVTVHVSAPPPVLAGTGNDTARQLLIGGLLVLVGGAVLLLARRRT
jgi:uncharacterized repeat protein (TIGR01451 family)